MRKFVALVALAVACVASGGTAVRAADECAEACARQWAADRQVCLDQLHTRLEEIETALRECVDGCDPADVACVAKCTRTANQQRATAQHTLRACLNRANTTGWNCVRACAPSPVKP